MLLIYLILCLGGLLHQTTEAVRRPVRSVIQCDRRSAVVATFIDDASCRRHCEQTYVNNAQDRSLRSANKNIFQAHLKHELVTNSIGERVHLLHKFHQQQQQQQQGRSDGPECCCLFEAPWPQYVRPEAIGRELDQTLIQEKLFAEKRVCLPIVLYIGLSKRTRASYDTLCKYLSQRYPLTILELMQYVEAAAYLNYMQPKHPAIMLVLHEKHVKRIKKQELHELREALYDHLLDDTYNRHLVELPGYQLKTVRLMKLMQTKREIPNALKADMIYRSFEEMAVSQVLMDVAAASYRLRELNNKQFQVPHKLLAGDYDKYDSDLAAYFTMPPEWSQGGLTCKLISKTTNEIHIYLSALKSLLDPFREKGLHEHMARKYQPLIDIFHTKKIYENLMRVNCHFLQV